MQVVANHRKWSGDFCKYSSPQVGYGFNSVTEYGQIYLTVREILVFSKKREILVRTDNEMMVVITYISTYTDVKLAIHVIWNAS